MPCARLTVRVQRAEKLSAPMPQAELGLSPPKFKLRKPEPSSRTIAGLPDRVWLLKYSPFHRSVGTVATQSVTHDRFTHAPPTFSKNSSLISCQPVVSCTVTVSVPTVSVHRSNFDWPST